VALSYHFNKEVQEQAISTVHKNGSCKMAVS
jgi:hypothetical protein